MRTRNCPAVERLIVSRKAQYACGLTKIPEPVSATGALHDGKTEIDLWRSHAHHKGRYRPLAHLQQPAQPPCHLFFNVRCRRNFHLCDSNKGGQTSTKIRRDLSLQPPNFDRQADLHAWLYPSQIRRFGSVRGVVFAEARSSGK